jgi:pyrrolidone-carboxylate peptidase
LPLSEQPDVALSLGVSSKAQLEEAPQNWIGASPTSKDGAGKVLPHARIDARSGKKKRIKSDLPLKEIEEAMKQMHGKSRMMRSSKRNRKDYSPDASAYLCNYLNWKLTKLYKENHRVIAGFVHIVATLPPSEVQTVVQAVVNNQIMVDRDLDKRNCKETGGKCMKRKHLTESCAGTAHNGFDDCSRGKKCCFAQQERQFFDTGL